MASKKNDNKIAMKTICMEPQSFDLMPNSGKYHFAYKASMYDRRQVYEFEYDIGIDEETFRIFNTPNDQVFFPQEKHERAKVSSFVNATCHPKMLKSVPLVKCCIGIVGVSLSQPTRSTTTTVTILNPGYFAYCSSYSCEQAVHNSVLGFAPD